jgi:hypothetical protein
MTITMQSVQSSQIKAIGYDAPSETLRVQFNSGAVYDYAGVPAGAHTALAAASSIGAHFGKNIRTLYQGVLVTSPDENYESS